MSWVPRIAVVAVAALMPVLTGAAPATAAASGSASQGPRYAPTMLILDGSGSMNDKAGGDQSKIAAAKEAVHTLIDQTPAQAKVGLEVYGTHTGSSPADKAKGCQDITVLHPVGTLDKQALDAAVDGVKASGYTPIGAALQKAAAALPWKGPRSIVLVSDGIDTCAPPAPCDVARKLRGAGVDLVVHTVGLAVDDNAKKQLTCIAQATGGTYTDAPDSDTLKKLLPRVTASALRNYTPAGIPIDGTHIEQGAPPMKPGQYLDSMGNPEIKYYTVTVPKGDTAFVTATIIYSWYAGEQVDLKAYGPDGKECGGSGSQGQWILTHKIATATIHWAANGKGKHCSKAGRYVVSLKRSHEHHGRTPVELQVALQPPVSSNAGPPAATSVLDYSDPGGPNKPVIGGGDFATAATLDGSGHYSDFLQYGETTFYKVHLDWGQSLSYQVKGDKLKNANFDNTQSLHVDTRLYNPLRTKIGDQGADWWTPNDVSINGDPSSAHSGDSALATPTVLYHNTDSGNDQISAASFAGWYFIMLHLNKRGSGKGGTTFHIDLKVAGTPIKGPVYAYPNARARQLGVLGNGRTPGQSPNDLVANIATAATKNQIPVLPVVIGAALAAALAAAGMAFGYWRKRRA